MARTYTGHLRVKAPLKPTVLQEKLLNIIDDKEVMREAHRLLGEQCNKFVPKKTGTLRASMKAYPQTVRWETPYAHYQYMGEVYGPNYPGAISGSPAWRSPEGGGSKYPMGRELGIPGIAVLYPRWQKGEPRVKVPLVYTFGYTTPNTHHHWFDEAMKNGGKRTYSIRVTNMLKKKAKELGKTW